MRVATLPALRVLWNSLGVVEWPEVNFNHVEPIHCEQGFSWRPGNATFFTVGSAGVADVEVWQHSSWRPEPTACRVIRVPFAVAYNKLIVCDPAYHPESAGEPKPFQLAPGDYALYFETGWITNDSRVAELGYLGMIPRDPRHRPTWCRLTFVPSDSVEVLPCVLCADDELKPPAELDMDGEPISHPNFSDRDEVIAPRQYESEQPDFSERGK